MPLDGPAPPSIYSDQICFQKHYYTVSQSIQDTHNEEVVGERWFWATEQSFIGEKKGLKCCSVVQLKIL